MRTYKDEQDREWAKAFKTVKRRATTTFYKRLLAKQFRRDRRWRREREEARA